MAQLRQDYLEFVKRGAEVIAVGPEKAEVFANWWREHQMPFIGLPDPEHTVSKRYGQQKRGLIRYLHYGTSMSDIVDNGELLAKLDQLNLE